MTTVWLAHFVRMTEYELIRLCGVVNGAGDAAVVACDGESLGGIEILPWAGDRIIYVGYAQPEP